MHTAGMTPVSRGHRVGISPWADHTLVGEEDVRTAGTGDLQPHD